LPELEPAVRIGRYQLVSAIGAGGMGKVWVALDTAAPAQRLVALKTALAGGAADRDFWAMLSDEAALASRIQHQNVCATYELGQQDGVHFLVMEWSDGASLRDLLDASPGKRIAPDLGAYIAACVAAGLHAAHELADDEGHPLNVVHRDVSPQNVLISLRGHVRLADFGVAKARGQLHRPTETGEVKGKLSYMAPEQIASKNIDRRADVFALGCVLYEATLGVRPFHGPDAMATMYKILEEAVQLPRGVDPAFPEGLQKVLERALVKDPDLRFQTADEFRAALIEYLGSTKRFIADKHVAESLSGALGEQLRTRNKAIVASAEQLRRGETDPANIKSPPPPPPTKTLTPEGGVERTITAARHAKSARWRVGLGVTALVMALGATLFLGRDRSRELPAAAAGTSAGTTLPGPAMSLAPVQVASGAVPTEPPPSAAPASPPNASAPEPVRGPRTTRPSVRPPLPTPISSGASKAPARAPRPIDQSNPFAKP
jgi:eukaryotic-like serine/threonine-protein kinase